MFFSCVGMSALQTRTEKDFIPFDAICYRPSFIFGFSCSLILFTNKSGQSSFHKCLSRHWECQAQRYFPTTACLLPLSPWAGRWCAILENQIIRSTQWVNFVILPPANSPNRHMAGEEFWRGNNNGFVSSRQKSGWKWELKLRTFTHVLYKIDWYLSLFQYW